MDKRIYMIVNGETRALSVIINSTNETFGLFLWFKQLKFKENRVITWLAKHSLSVYLIHMCPFVEAFIFTEIMKVNQLKGYTLGIAIIIIPLAICLVCSIIDSIVEPIITVVQRNCTRSILRVQSNIAESKK